MSQKMWMWAGLCLFLALVLASAAGCGSSQEIKVEDADDGRQIELAKGQILAISLESNPSTGYGWEAVDLDESLLQKKGDPEFTSRSDLVGASGVETLHFEAVGAGTATLKLVYHRSWEKDVEPLKTFSVQIMIR